MAALKEESVQDILKIAEEIKHPQLSLEILAYTMKMQDKYDFSHDLSFDAQVLNNVMEQTCKLNVVFEALIDENECEGESSPYPFFEEDYEWKGMNIVESPMDIVNHEGNASTIENNIKTNVKL
ncbi:hypothetical protein KI387_025354, partial [Taxus chinensis]